MKNVIKLAVVDDQHLFRTGLISLFKEFDELKIVIEASNGKEFIDQIEKQKPDVVLLDVEMPIMDGFETTEYLKKHHPDIKVLILTMYGDESVILHLMENGANGFLLKNSNIETMVEAINSVAENGYFFNDSVTKSMVKGLTGNKTTKPKFNKADVSKRETEVIKMICRGYTNKEIADKLFISVRTVDFHREKILSKTKARNTAGIVMYAFKNNLMVIPQGKR